MAIETIHLSVGGRGSTVTEENSHLMGRFRVIGQEIPKDIGILQVCARITLLGVNEVGELDRITDEEDWSVVHNKIAVSFLRVKLDSKSTGIASCISRTGNDEAKDTRVSIMCAMTTLIQSELNSAEAVCAYPDSPPTVEKRQNAGVFLPMPFKNLAVVR
jgi:hypothetical protein